jgi:hypothetical protein
MEEVLIKILTLEMSVKKVSSALKELHLPKAILALLVSSAKSEELHK